jgi:hypothetical protein
MPEETNVPQGNRQRPEPWETNERRDPNIHRLGGIGAFLRTVTHAGLQRPLGSAPNSARPTVTVRPSGKGSTRGIELAPVV